ncbi:hypothetical protein M0R45_002400 [Rubus argutus]|uniref:Uncharacterized protein n=1 Tax=Rubus argutus TaxID=59490 RepID=A0AAW1VRP0_RUBAR
MVWRPARRWKRGGEREAGGGVVFWAHGRERRGGIRRCTTGSGGSWLGFLLPYTSSLCFVLFSLEQLVLLVVSGQMRQF